MHEKILIIFVLINIPVVLFYKNITKYINIFDKADNVRKFHKNKVALFGGTILIYNILSFFTLNFLFFEYRLLVLNIDTRELASLILGSILFFSVGLYDDKFNLSANKKLLLNFFLLIFLIFLDENLVIKDLKFSFFDNPIELRNFSYIFSILCILLLINALNMFDGINLQVGTYCTIIFLIFIFKELFVQLSIICVLTVLLFLAYNFKNKAFLGDSGTQVLAFIISFILIKSYNSNNAFTPEEIFIILSIPGLDMLRLFLQRLIKGKNPFYPDRNHIHHILLSNVAEKYAFILIQILILLSISNYYILDEKVVSIILTIFFYLIFILLFSKKRKKTE